MSKNTVTLIRKQADPFEVNYPFALPDGKLTHYEFALLRKYVNKKMIELCEDMLSGDIKIQPTKHSNRTHCEYCDFSAICQFDSSIKDNKYKIIIKKPQNDIWNSIEKEISNSNEVSDS